MSDRPDFTSIALIKGQYGGSPVTIAVDASGNIIGLFQGDYEGALKTLAVDTKGRILAVLTDPEDVFGNANSMGAAELAARLGSIDTHERRGTVIFMESFESGVLNKWSFTLSAGATAALSTKYARNGAFSLRLYSGVGAGKYALAKHFLPYPALSKVGGEIWVNIPDATDSEFDFFLYLYDGSTYKRAIIEYNPSTREVSVWDGAMHVFATGVAPPTPGGFLVFKLVVNLASGTYVGCLINSDLYDLSGYTLESGASTTAKSFGVWLGAYYYNAALVAYVDDVILTQNES